MIKFSGLQRAASHAAGVVGLLAVLLAMAPSAHAQRAFARRFPAPAAQPLSVKGDIVLVGNHVVSCPDPGTNASCANALNGTNATARNNDFTMAHVNVDPDGGANFNSSTATLALPAGSTVLFAGLYWNGRSDAVARTQVRWKRPGSATYTTLTADSIDVIDTYDYQAFKDVTADIAAAGNGAYSVANVQSFVGAADRWGSWTLVVAYGNAAGTLRNLSVFDGFQRGAGNVVDVAISGFYTPIAGTVNTNLGMVVYDGDRGQGDGGNSLEFGPDLLNLQPVFNDRNPVTDVWNSSITVPGLSGTLADNVTAGRNPASANLLGLDIDNLRPNTSLPNGSTSAALRYRSTSADVNFPGVITLATDAFEPEIVTSFTKTAVDDNGSAFRPGDLVTYTISLTNQGNDNSVQTVVSDPLPAGVTYVPGTLEIVSGANAGMKTDTAVDDQATYDAVSRTVTFRVGMGANGTNGGTVAPAASATLRFKVQINPVAHGTSLANVAEVDYVSGTSNQAGSGTTPPSTITVTGEADLSIAKTGPATVLAGEAISYVVTALNAGQDAADGAIVNDSVPAGITGVTITCVAAGGATCPNTAGLATLANVAIPVFPSGGSVEFTIAGTAPAVAGTLSNTATIASPTNTVDPTPGNNTAGPVVTDVQEGDLAVTNVVSAGPHYPGQTVTYTVTATNNGAAMATSVSLNDTLPGTLTFVSLSAPAGWSATTPAVGTGGTITATIASLAPGASATFVLVAEIPAGTPDGAVFNDTATVGSATPDTNVGNNSATAGFTVSAGADLSLAKTLATAGPYAQGQAITYTLAVSNAGPLAATNVQVTDTPSNLTITGVSGAGCSAMPCTIASIAAGATANVTVTATINGPGAFDNVASVTASEADPVPGDNTDSTGNGGTAAASADLAVTNVLASASPAATGSVVSYTITVSNNGPSAVSGATLAETVPPQLTGVTWTCAAGCATASGSGDINTLVNVPVGGSITITVSGTAPATTPSTIAATTAAVTLPAGTVDANPANNSATAPAVPVSARAIDAIDDAGSRGGAAGGTAIANVLGNDAFNGAGASTGTVTLDVVTPASTPNVSLDTTTGAVTVAPGTPSGTYTISYRICETANPGNCDTATATVTLTSATLVANNDAGTSGGQTGGIAIADVLGNDALNGGAPTTANVVLTQVSTTQPNVTLDAATGAVRVAPGTPAGTYAITYRICETINPTNCTTAIASVTVTAAVIDAVNDAAGPVQGNTGATGAVNVLGNDTLGGIAATTSNVSIAPVVAGPLTLDANGAVDVAAGTPAGTYALTYTICERLNPSNCDTATVSVTVVAATLVANDDSTPPVNGVVGNPAITNVLGNDTLGGMPATLATVTLAQVSTSSPAVTLDPGTGNVAVAAGTPAGTYTLVYRICEQLNPANCDDATVTVNVAAPTLVADDDSSTTRQNTAVAIAVLGNDTSSGVPVTATGVVVTIVNAPAHGTATVNADGSVSYTPATNYSGTDTLTYRLCDVVNPTVCDDAVVQLIVTPNTVDAVETTINTPQTGPVVIDPMASTRTGGGAPLDPTSVAVVTPPTNGTVVVNPNGTMTYTPNTTFFGTETFAYRICDRSMPTPVCDVATVTIVVAMQAPQLRISKATASRTVRIGDLVRYTVNIENTGVSPANNATVVDVPPRGFSFVEGSLSVDDADDRFVLAAADPLRITGIDVPVGGRATVVYLLRIGAGVGRGTHTNQVSAIDATGSTVSNTATADVTVEGEPMTDDSLILGTVFFDRDGDGVQDDGEPGLAGVRIASVEGLLIETDLHGRYHLAGIEGGHALRGRNFILKVDAATLPPGTTFTTANPLVRRVTPGLPVRFDFGVRLPSDDAQAGH